MYTIVAEGSGVAGLAALAVCYCYGHDDGGGDSDARFFAFTYCEPWKI